ncbi:MAG: crossover junction endodeoxyribonuclease RuvC [Clostridia bacterium]|nr:crossover junction endodeoxyribonuclease RuvC [Clostridia bacterium]
MIILGIDPGYAIIGYGVIRFENNRFEVIDFGAITTEAHTDFNDRLFEIYTELSILIAKHHPDVMSIEKLYFNTNQKTAIAVAEARGVILLSARQNNVPIFEYTPLEVKQSVVGYGRAEKQQVQAMIKVLLNLDAVPKPDDTADALAMAVCHAHTSGSVLGKLNSIY